MDNIQIDNEAFLEAFGQVQGTARKYGRRGIGASLLFRIPSWHGDDGICQVMDVEYIILETGIGRKAGCHQLYRASALAVITSISLDHTDILGDTIEEIAAEKAGSAD